MRHITVIRIHTEAQEGQDKDKEDMKHCVPSSVPLMSQFSDRNVLFICVKPFVATFAISCEDSLKVPLLSFNCWWSEIRMTESKSRAKKKTSAVCIFYGGLISDSRSEGCGFRSRRGHQCGNCNEQRGSELTFSTISLILCLQHSRSSTHSSQTLPPLSPLTLLHPLHLFWCEISSPNVRHTITFSATSHGASWWLKLVILK